MAMNKAEKAALEAAQGEIRLRELFVLLPEIPPDIPAPRASDTPTKGWMFNGHSSYFNVSRVMSNCAGHWPITADGKKIGSGTQGSRALYSTKELAYEAMKRAHVWNAARSLLEKVSNYERTH